MIESFLFFVKTSLHFYYNLINGNVNTSLHLIFIKHIGTLKSHGVGDRL